MVSDNIVFFEHEDGITVVHLAGHELSPVVREVLHKSLPDNDIAPPGRDFVLDLSQLTFLGSVGLTLLVVFFGRVKKVGGRVALAGLNRYCQEVIKVSGLTRLFLLYPDVPAALAGLRADIQKVS